MDDNICPERTIIRNVQVDLMVHRKDSIHCSFNWTKKDGAIHSAMAAKWLYC
ncbi:MAG: hypothetical protein ABIQ95_15125 [Bdellovibrionia bacterium]